MARRAQAVAVAALMAGCGAPAPSWRPAHTDPALGDAPAEALSEWHLATGGRYPERNISFVVWPITHVAVTEASADMSQPAFVLVYPGLDKRTLHRALLHELGHVAQLRFDPETGDAVHYYGPGDSVMRPIVDDCADEIGQTDLSAFDRIYAARP